MKAMMFDYVVVVADRSTSNAEAKNGITFDHHLNLEETNKARLYSNGEHSGRGERLCENQRTVSMVFVEGRKKERKGTRRPGVK